MYEFRTAEGKVCCKSDRIEHLCPACRAAAQKTLIPDAYAGGRKAAPSLGKDYQPFGQPPDSYASGRKA